MAFPDFRTNKEQNTDQTCAHLSIISAVVKQAVQSYNKLLRIRLIFYWFMILATFINPGGAVNPLELDSAFCHYD